MEYIIYLHVPKLFIAYIFSKNLHHMKQIPYNEI